MKTLLLSLIILISNFVFCQEGVFREKDVIRYTVKYETAAFVSSQIQKFTGAMKLKLGLKEILGVYFILIYLCNIKD